MHPAANRHAHLLQSIENIRTLAERADRNAIDCLLTQPSATSHLDDHTFDFLRHAQDLLLATARMLAGVLECSDHPRTIGIAEAWRRAHLQLSNHDDAPIIHIREFGEGYQAIPILAAIPEPPMVPTVKTTTTLIIDKSTGAVTQWPLLPLDVLARQYRRYMRQEPMIFGDCSR